MIKWIIFDMDGLLIDSEPLWKEAEAKAFEKVGIIFPTERRDETAWFSTVEVVDYWFSKLPWDVNSFPKQQVGEEIVNGVKDLITNKWVVKPWVFDILKFLKKKEVDYFAIASGSRYSVIEAALEKLGISSFFNIIHSAQDEAFGKPHPWIYTNTCKKMWLLPEQCISFEDSLNGIMASKWANIKCVAIPESHNFSNPKFEIADLLLPSLEDFWEREWSIVNYIN